MNKQPIIGSPLEAAAKARKRAEVALYRAEAEAEEAFADWLEDEDMSRDRPGYLRRLAAAQRALADVIEEDIA